MRAHYAKWERSNCLSLISIKRSISNNAKEFLVVVANRYQTSDNAEVGHFMDELMNMRYDDMKGVREYILKMVHLQTRLKALDIPIPDKFIVHQALNTLSSSFSQIKTAYNTLNQSWGVNNLITKCVAEEEKLKREKNESAHLIAIGKPNNKKRVEKTRKPNFHSHKKNKNFKKSRSEKQKNGNAKNTDLKCYHCNKKGHKRVNCFKFKNWLEKKKKEQADALEMFKVFRTKVGKQLGKVIKIMRSDRGDEYYGKHGDAGQQKGPFARYLQDNGIVAQYTMSGSPEQNGVAERHNRTLMEMKRSMMGRSNLPEYLWDEAIKTATYILNRVSRVATGNFPIVKINPIVDEIPPVEMRRSQRTKRPALSNDYYVYLGKGECDIREEVDPTTYCEALDASMSTMMFGNLLIFPKDINPLDANGYSRPRETTKEMLKDTRLSWLLKASSMDVKTTFLNGDLSEEVYMSQPEGFKENGKENMVCRLKRSIYGLKQASRQWYLKFDKIVTSFGFIKNKFDQCVYMKVNGTSFVLGIEIYRDRSRNLLGLSQRAYINRVLKRFRCDVQSR
ncbi:hypothetical protein AAG906_004181 [Vitis piasezkii]